MTDQDTRERIGLLMREGKAWVALDTFMDKTRTFPKRDEAIAWLASIASAE